VLRFHPPSPMRPAFAHMTYAISCAVSATRLLRLWLLAGGRLQSSWMLVRTLSRAEDPAWCAKAKKTKAGRAGAGQISLQAAPDEEMDAGGGAQKRSSRLRRPTSSAQVGTLHSCPDGLLLQVFKCYSSGCFYGAWNSLNSHPE
jgi:hypothetical protein